jgi:hypothetical protein
MRSLAISLAALLLIPAAASAKSGLEVLGANPVGLAAGQPWEVGVVGIRRDHRVEAKKSVQPAVEIKRSGSGTYRFALRRQPDDSYTSRVVFPTSGSWTYRVSGFGSLGAHQHWEPVRVAPSAQGNLGSASDPAGGASSDELDIPFGWIAALSPMIVAIGFLVARRRSAGRAAGVRPTVSEK